MLLDSLLNVGTHESRAVALNAWLNAYEEIADKHPELKDKADQLSERIREVSEMASHDDSYGLQNCDEMLYGERSQQYMGSTRAEREAFIRDFPCGNTGDMEFARDLFSIREMAYLQMGLTEELDADDFSEVPRKKSFRAANYTKEYDDASLVMGRRGFIHECLGLWEEAIDCYLAMKPMEYIIKARIRDLESRLPFGMLETHEDGKTVRQSGYLYRDRILGVTLLKETVRQPDGTERYRMGCSKTEVTGEVCGAFWDGPEVSPYAYEGEIQLVTDDNVCGFSIKKGSKQKPSYCGKTPEGLGVKFFHAANGKSNRFVAIPGLWRNGELTHLVCDGRLVALYEYMSKEDADAVIKAINAMVNMDASQLDHYRAVKEAASAMKCLDAQEFSPEMIDTFCEEKFSWVEEYNDLDVHGGSSRAGFKIDGCIRGFMWRRTWDNGPGSVDNCYCGLWDDRETKKTFVSYVRYQPERTIGFMESDYKMTDLVERDAYGKIVFCGMHKDGVRHGLGSEFFYKTDGKIVEIQGLWQNGVLTHKRRKDKLVPFDEDYYEGEENKLGVRQGRGSIDYKWDNCYYVAYKGDWAHGQRSGRGGFIKFYDLEGTCMSFEYYGEWLDDQLHGKGTAVWGQEGELLERFDGDFKDGVRCGHGITTYGDGDRFECDYVNDLANGHGKYTFSDGDSFEGEWKDGEQVEE